MDKIIIQATINAPIEQVWSSWTLPEHIVNWNNASDDWHTPHATNDLRVGGKFLSRMEAKDGSFGFDFEGIYSKVEHHKLIEYGLADGRQVSTQFISNDDNCEVITIFDPETENPVEMQKGGWQAILDNFKKYVEQ
jgi:uncharacterized protein YndB with AHSA1/START domain